MDMTTVSLDKKTRDKLIALKDSEGRETFDRLLNRMIAYIYSKEKKEEEN